MEFSRAHRNKKGVALFMVLSAISILAVLVTEFVYIGQVNKRIAYEGLDQIRAYYLAKSALKVSLLRIKAYTIVKDFVNANGAAGAVPASAFDQIWSFPLVYPIPSNVPGLSITQRDSIDKFTKSSSIEGTFSAIIEAESSKYNVNSILPAFAYVTPAPSPSPSVSPSPSPSPSPSFNPETARQSLQDYLTQLFFTKFRDDRDFADLYRDFRVEDLTDSIVSWADPTYESKRPKRNDINSKRAPFYSITELRMLPEVDDTIYGILSQALTTSLTPGIHINTMKQETLSALVPQMTKDETTAFFKFRDSVEKDNHFKSVDDFYTYLTQNVGAFRNASAIDDLKKSIAQKNIVLLIDEKEFRVTVTANINGTTRVIQALVSLTPTKKGGQQLPAAPPAPSTTGSLPVGPDGKVIRGDPGFRITFMRIW